MNRRLLLVGPGYLGAEIQREFEAVNWEVITVSRSNSDYQVDLADERSVSELAGELFDIGKAPSHIIHCASASAGRGASPEVRLASYQDVYLNGCRHLAKLFTDAHLLFTSSTSVYGQKDGSTVTEESLTDPGADTAKVLVEAERAVLSVNGTVVRLSGIYGVGKSYLIKRLFSGNAVMEGEGKRILNHIHHHDGASACLFLLDRGEKGIFNVSETVNLTLKETYTKLCKRFELDMPMSSSVDGSSRMELNKRVSNQKMLDLGWLPKYPSIIEAADDVARSMGLV